MTKLDKNTLIDLRDHVEYVRAVSGSPVSKVTPAELELVYNSPLAEAPHTELICSVVTEWLNGFIEEIEING